MDYQISVRAKLDLGHDIEKTVFEEESLTKLMAGLTDEQKNSLEGTIDLVAASSGQPNQSPSIRVPRRIRLMSKLIDDLLKQDEEQTQIPLFLNTQCLQLFVDYCGLYDFIKIKSTLAFPTACNCTSKNCSSAEFKLIWQITNDLDAL